MKKGVVAAVAAAAVALAAAPTSQAACGLTDCQQITGTVDSLIAVTAAPVVTLSNTGVPGQLQLGSSAADAAGSGLVEVVATTGYCMQIQDTGNNGLLTNALGAASGQFTTPLQWSSTSAGVVTAAGTPADLSNTAADVVLSAGNTLLDSYTIDYVQALAGQNVPAGAYATTAQFTASAC